MCVNFAGSYYLPTGMNNLLLKRQEQTTGQYSCQPLLWVPRISEFQQYLLQQCFVFEILTATIEIPATIKPNLAAVESCLFSFLLSQTPQHTKINTHVMIVSMATACNGVLLECGLVAQNPGTTQSCGINTFKSANPNVAPRN